MRSVLGEPTGTSGKFAAMMVQALDAFAAAHGVQFERVTRIALEGEGTIGARVDKLYAALCADAAWLADLRAADAVLVATHSQGSIVSTHLLDRIVADGRLKEAPRARVACLALCGIHQGPLRYLSTSTLLQPYIQYFESAAARELFEFQDTGSAVSQAYAAALQRVLAHGTKMVYVASLNDQVVPIYSGVFAAAAHPLILRALYIDGDAYHSSDFLARLLALLLRMRNAGLDDAGLLTHLSEATAGSLSGVGHSTVYEERACYALAVDYLFLADDGRGTHALALEAFNAAAEQNDYEIPWALRGVVADPRVGELFADEVAALRDAFRAWHPRTAVLRDMKRKLQPITRLRVGAGGKL